jgi:hypothetical protein
MHMRSLARLCLTFLWLALSLSAHAEPPAVPPSNRADLREAPARPSAESVQAQAALLFDAIVHDDPARAASVFFPREAFVQVKAMQKAERYYDRLRARFDQDIHALHRATPDLARASFE